MIDLGAVVRFDLVFDGESFLALEVGDHVQQVALEPGQVVQERSNMLSVKYFFVGCLREISARHLGRFDCKIR